MSLRILAIVACLLLAAAGAVLVVSRAPERVSDADLAQRVADSQPTWQNYQEDIKGQIGAAPVAEWEGAPESVQRDANIVQVTFRLRGPWTARVVALPVLMREPRGGVYRNADAICTGGCATYVFELPGETAQGALPWIEVKYPFNERRLVLFDNGSWHAAP